MTQSKWLKLWSATILSISVLAACGEEEPVEEIEQEVEDAEEEVEEEIEDAEE